MVYVPTFLLECGHFLLMWVNIPYMDSMGNSALFGGWYYNLAPGFLDGFFYTVGLHPYEWSYE